MNRIVVFYHPGSEAWPPKGLAKIAWNKLGDKHKKKFVRIGGKYLKKTDAQSEQFSGEICFWAEWEAPSNVEVMNEEPCQGGPKYIQKPFLREATERDLMNTDPLVFGDCFLYSNCMQHGYKSLKDLRKDDIILFGSHLGGGFVLDTLFVVDKCYPYRSNEIEKLAQLLGGEGGVSKEQFDLLKKVTLERMCCSFEKCSGGEYVLYTAKMYNGMTNTPFSFFPCKPVIEGGLNGFCRPIIELPLNITENQKRGIKIKISDSQDIFSKICQQVTNAGLCFGIHADVPTLKQH